MFGQTFVPVGSSVERFNFSSYTSLGALTANQNPFAGTLARKILLLSWKQFVNPQPPNDAANFWTIVLAYNAAINFASFTTVGLPAIDNLVVINSFSNNPADPAVDPAILVKCTKTGAPGTLFVFHPWLEYARQS